MQLKDISDFRLMVMFFILLVPYIFVLLFWMTYSTPSSQVLTEVVSGDPEFIIVLSNTEQELYFDLYRICILVYMCVHNIKCVNVYMTLWLSQVENEH